MAIKILLMDNNKLFREGLRFILENQPDIVVVGEASVGRDAVRLAKKYAPDLVLIDLDFSNLELASQIQHCSRNSRILALTTRSDQDYVAAVLRVGVAGYVLKDCDSIELINAVRELIAGRGYISPTVAPLILAAYAAHQVSPVTGSELNRKEIEVLRLLSDGLDIDAIARNLGQSGKTVVRYRRKIMEKLNVHSIAGLTKYAVKKGISQLD